jgi:hypothetical protein
VSVADPQAVRLANAACTLVCSSAEQDTFAQQALARLVVLHERHGCEVVGASFAAMSSEGKLYVVMLAVSHLAAFIDAEQEHEPT